MAMGIYENPSPTSIMPSKPKFAYGGDLESIHEEYASGSNFGSTSASPQVLIVAEDQKTY